MRHIVNRQQYKHKSYLNIISSAYHIIPQRNYFMHTKFEKDHKNLSKTSRKDPELSEASPR